VTCGCRLTCRYRRKCPSAPRSTTTKIRVHRRAAPSLPSDTIKSMWAGIVRIPKRRSRRGVYLLISPINGRTMRDNAAATRIWSYRATFRMLLITGWASRTIFSMRFRFVIRGKSSRIGRNRSFRRGIRRHFIMSCRQLAP